MKIYISGPMTGIKDFNKDAFDLAELKLRREGHVVFSPAILPQSDRITYQQYMDIDLAMLRACDAIYMLDDWNESKGARFEHDYALILGLKVLLESDSL